MAPPVTVNAMTVTGRLAALVCSIGFINAYNRVNAIGRNRGGDYQPGQWG